MKYLCSKKFHPKFYSYGLQMLLPNKYLLAVLKNIYSLQAIARVEQTNHVDNISRSIDFRVDWRRETKIPFLRNMTTENGCIDR